MRTFIFLSTLLFSLFAQAEQEIGDRLNTARETMLAKVEFNESSKSGFVRVKDCSKCRFEMYNIIESTKVTRNNATVPIGTLLAEYWNIKMATLLISLNSQELQAIHYYK